MNNTEKAKRQKEFVEELPRRVAEVTLALMECARDHRNEPARASEVCHYDENAPSVGSTGSALQRARKRGLVQLWYPYWVPSFVAMDMKYDLERRIYGDDDA